MRVEQSAMEADREDVECEGNLSDGEGQEKEGVCAWNGNWVNTERNKRNLANGKKNISFTDVEHCEERQRKLLKLQ